LIDIKKKYGDIFYDEFERLLHERLPSHDMVRFRNPTCTKPVPVPVGSR